MTPKSPINFFTDEDVPRGIGEYLRGRGHNVTRLQDKIAKGSPDPIVAATCREAGLVLVTFNYKDFEKILRESDALYIAGKRPTKKHLKTMHRVDFNCDHHVGLSAIKNYIDIVESELSNTEQSVDQRIMIGTTHCRIYRQVRQI